jgi:heptosyltransferase-3
MRGADQHIFAPSFQREWRRAAAACSPRRAIARARSAAGGPATLERNLNLTMRQAAQESVSRVLVYRLGSIGDFVIALPCLHLIRRSFPRAEVRLLTNLPVDARAAPAMSVLDGTGLLDGFVAYKAGTRDPRELWHLAKAIRAYAPDLLVYLASPRGTWPVYRDYLFFRGCGIGKMVGVPFSRNDRFCRPHRTADGLWEREAERLARCLAPLGDAKVEHPASWDLALSEAELDAADEKLRTALGGACDGKFVAFSVGTKQKVNDWGDENWGETLAALRPSGLALVLIGSAEDRERSQRLVAGWAAPVVNFCGQLSPRLSAAVMRRARLLLCHDSGPMHLAAAVGTPCVAVFSRLNSPGQWYPVGDKHWILYPPPEAQSIAAITPREVIDAVMQALAELEPLAEVNPRTRHGQP